MASDIIQTHETFIIYAFVVLWIGKVVIFFFLWCSIWSIYKWHTTSSDIIKGYYQWNSSVKSRDFTPCTRHSSLKQSTLYLSQIKKLKICSRWNNNMQCLCSNAQLHMEFLLCTFFFLTCLILVKHLISLKSFIYWVITLNAFNFKTHQPFI